MRQVPVLSIDGKKIGSAKLPEQFLDAVRADLIKRAVLALQSAQRQPYGIDPLAGTRTSAKMKTLRRAYGSWTERGIARVPRIRWGSGGMTGTVRRSAHAVKGRTAVAPHAEKVWLEKINKKERRKAIRAALAACADKKIVASRGHRIEKIASVPLVTEDKMQELKKTSAVRKMLEKIGLADELLRAGEKKVRAGKGKMRGRKYKKKVGPIIVVAEDKGVGKAGKNIAGIDVVAVQNLNAALLAPGAKAGRLTIFSKAALEKLEKEKLFAK